MKHIVRILIRIAVFLRLVLEKHDDSTNGEARRQHRDAPPET